MILQALHAYYERRCADPDPARRLASFGLERKEIGFVLELDATGALKSVVDLRQPLGKRLVGTALLVPQAAKKTSGIKANLLWDNAEYVLALPEPKKLEAARAKGKEDEYRARLIEMQQAFGQRIEALPEPARSDPGVQAVLNFLRQDPAAQLARLGRSEDIASAGASLSFRLIDDDGRLVSQRPAVAPAVVAWADEDEREDTDAAATEASAAPGLCLIRGEAAPIARLHTAIKGVWGAQSSGANIVSFNLDAFNSYGKTQGGNAPVGVAAAFAYTTALNTLLARDSTQRLQVGDASTVFWAQRADRFEEDLTALLGADLDDPDAHVAQVGALYDAIHSGAFDGARGENRFYVLGLAPNAARIAVRFWHAAPLVEIAARVRDWFDDLSLVRPAFERDPFPALKRLLRALVLEGDLSRLPPGLCGDILRAIFTGAPLPAMWLNLAVQRCRAEQAVPYARAAAIKACLNRSIRHARSFEEVYTPMLDPANAQPAYRLGRLFAVLEKIQEESAGGSLNKTIRDRYYGAASSTPASVVPLLLKLKNHHLGKLDDRGQRMLYRAFQDHRPDDYIAEVLAALDDIPAHLTLPEQGRFALGYYHQRQAFFSKPDAATDTAQPEGAA
ncbi:MAG TPA: type I-C CRISPR-associated protein Cas8c/Csd1 [Rubrivivax sp.]|nr:type I-C CRISPR-associated protein Cas8c/Csd1 [Burkholderiales bacterium]HNT40077.1 type I-C CRISPR-associated protein Cas8c/Csd1 [Rubrivivax sp.]